MTWLMLSRLLLSTLNQQGKGGKFQTTTTTTRSMAVVTFIVALPVLFELLQFRNRVVFHQGLVHVKGHWLDIWQDHFAHEGSGYGCG